MDNIGYFVAACLFIVAINVGANLIAQRLYPTFASQSERQVPYTAVFVGSLLALLAACGLVLFILEAMFGYTL